MTTFSFPAATFAIEGSPEAVRDTSRSYGRFATTAQLAAADLRGLDSGFWVGTEGDLFRGKVGDIPPHLEVAGAAFAQVARALDGFADVLDQAQRRLGGVRADAEHTFHVLASVRAARLGLREPGTDPAAQRAYDEQRRALDTRIGGLEAAWEGQLAAATGLRNEVLEAAQRTAGAVRAAGRTSPTADQGWLADKWEDGRRWAAGRLDDLKQFVADHAHGFRSLAKALRWAGMALVAIGATLAAISFVAGLFSLGIGWLGELPAGAIMAAGFALWGAGDALDSTVDWAEGRIDGRELVFRAGLAIVTSVAGGALLKLGAEALERLGPRLRRWAGEALRRPEPALAGATPGGPPRLLPQGRPGPRAAEGGRTRYIRQDDAFSSRADPRDGAPKAHIDPATGELRPPDPNGDRSLVRHLVNDRRQRQRDPYISFQEVGPGRAARRFGGWEVKLDADRLERDVLAGRISGVEVLRREDLTARGRAWVAERYPGLDIDHAIGEGRNLDRYLNRQYRKQIYDRHQQPAMLHRYLEEVGASQPGLAQDARMQAARDRARLRASLEFQQLGDVLKSLYYLRENRELTVKGVIPPDYYHGPYRVAR